MTSLRYNVDERGHMRPSPNGEYVAFNQYEMLGYSNIKGWALAKSLQAQVDILQRFVDQVINAPADTSLTFIVAHAHTTLDTLKRHRES